MFTFRQYFKIEFSFEIIDTPWNDSDVFLATFYGPNGEILGIIEL